MQGIHTDTHTNFNNHMHTGVENTCGYVNVDIMYLTGALASKPFFKNEKRKESSSRKRDLG